MKCENEPISYDDHGDIPFEVPFREIPSSEISIYLQLDTRVGQATCRQRCAHCFYINQPAAADRMVDLEEGRRIMDSLRRHGFRVFPMIADSLAQDGQFLRLFGNTHNRDYRQELECVPTKTMARGDCWTSGAPLMDDNWRDILTECIVTGFGSVTITFHGVLDEHLALRPHDTYPIKGVFPGFKCEEVIRRIRQFNADMLRGDIEALDGVPKELVQPLAVNIGLTIGRHNYSSQHLRRYVDYFNRLNVDVLRFNRFHDHGFRLPGLTLSNEEVAVWYRDLKAIHENVELGFQLGVDEDFGTSGIEVMAFPAHTGWCRAGRQLFAVVPEPPAIVARTGRSVVESIGTIAACVDAFKPLVGRLERFTDMATGETDYDLRFDVEAIDLLNQKRVSGVYSDGCFAVEMLDEDRQKSRAAAGIKLQMAN